MNFSKSKLMAFRQCKKRLWLEVHRPELRVDSNTSQAAFDVGYKVGDIARTIYDPNGLGHMIDITRDGFAKALELSQSLLNARNPVFEAGFSANGVIAFSDVMLPVNNDGKNAWKMVEVKSSTQVKDYHHDDIAVQAYVAITSGTELEAIVLAHIDSSWVYPGDNQYSGLLKEVDLTEEAFSRTEEVESWVVQAKDVIKQDEPIVSIGDQCSQPFDCGFYDYCSRDEPKAEYPIQWLPRFNKGKAKALAEQGIVDLREVPDKLLNATQQIVKKHTISNKPYFDKKSTQTILAALPLPAYFLDFETIMFPVPIWKGTRPYQQITFQFSLHVLNKAKELEHHEFLDISGQDPSLKFAEALISSCRKMGPIYVYNAGFENARIRELAERYPALSEDLLALTKRVVDLLPITRNHYYHPSQQGSWSIKKVLPAIVPELSYADLEGVKDGGMAMDAFIEAIHASTTFDRKAEIEQQLLAYCKMDTYAMVKLWQVFSGQKKLSL